MPAKSRRSTGARPDATPPPVAEPTALDYAAWKKAAREMLREQHGITAAVRERDWRVWYIAGTPPDAAAQMARVNYDNSRPAAERTRRR